MVVSRAFSFSSDFPFGFLRSVGFRRQALHRFLVYFASSTYAVRSRSYDFARITSPPWPGVFAQFAPAVELSHAVFIAASNRAVKRTDPQRTAYFVR
ncbi:DUF1010 domain-containing protein [Simplicispira suum]|uniref:DUF1010 domain-containing protein n=1 Tax=Simplicispira suum TaxID=2109915 RepID=UPI0011B214DC